MFVDGIRTAEDDTLHIVSSLIIYFCNNLLEALLWISKINGI